MAEIVVNSNFSKEINSYKVVSNPSQRILSPTDEFQRVSSYGPMIDELLNSLPGRNAELDKFLIMALIYGESRGNPRARNVLPARGISQFIDGTAVEQGVIDPYNYADCLKGKVKFANAGMTYMKKHFKDIDTIKAYTIAFHLGGYGVVKNYKTLADLTTKISIKNYVAQAEKYYRKFGGPGFTLPA